MTQDEFETARETLCGLALELDDSGKDFDAAAVGSYLLGMENTLAEAGRYKAFTHGVVSHVDLLRS